MPDPQHPQRSEAVRDPARVTAVELPTLGHTIEDGFLPPSIRALGPVGRIAGPARVVDLVEPDAIAVNLAILALEPGEVLVVRVHGARHAPVGAVTRAALVARGAAGVVVDGPVTDSAVLEVGAAELPVWAAGTTARTTKRLGTIAPAGSATIAGVAVRDGDLVVADRDGVLVAPEGIPVDVLERAAASDADEPALIAAIEAGEPLEGLLKTEGDA